jgi:hypothetical protein
LHVFFVVEQHHQKVRLDYSTFVLVAVVTLGEWRIFGMAQAQGNLTSELTPEQKAAVCASVGSHVNTTESRICGIPTTPSSNTTSSENMTTGAEAPPTDLAPSAAPPSE